MRFGFRRKRTGEPPAPATLPTAPETDEETAPAQRLRLIVATLADCGVELSPEELLDTLWLARRLPADASAPLARAGGTPRGRYPEEPVPAPDAPAEAVRHDPSAAVPEPGQPPGPGPEAAAPAVPRPGEEETGPEPSRPPRQPLALHAAPASDAPLPHTPVQALRAPAPRASRFGQLQLSRSLRPLKLRVSDPRGLELDETATADRMAETGLTEAVVRPSLARWLDVTVLIDDGTSMLLWQRLATEVKNLLERSGAFRAVRVLGLNTRGPHAPMLSRRPFLADTAPLPPSTVTDTAGRTLVLVVSDGVGAAWRDGRMEEQLRQWARFGPTAALNALPPHLWEGSGLRAARWRVTTRRRGAPNLEWDVSDPVLPTEVAEFDGVPVPVLAPDPVALGTWAGLVASPGTSAVLPLLARPTAVRFPEAETQAGAAQAVLRFRETASPEAYRLAAHLAAVAPVTVPVMRLVQQVLGPRFDAGHLAEVFLGGLMRRADTMGRAPVPQHRRYDFGEGTRDILLGTTPPVELLRSGRAVADRLAELVGRSPDFPAWLAHPDGADRIGAQAHPFGWIDQRLLRRLGVTAPDTEAPDPVPEEPGEALRETGADPAVPDLPDYVDAPGSQWRSLRRDDPRTAGGWQLFARHRLSRTEWGIFLGRDEAGRTATVRLTRPKSSAHASIRRQAATLRAVRGAGVPALLEADDRWLATELVVTGSPPRPAPSLADRVEGLGRLGREEFLRVGQQVAGVLARAHAQGVVHGNLSAERILLSDHDAYVTGWGVDQHPDNDDHDVSRLGSLLLSAADSGVAGDLRTLLQRCGSPVLADRPSAAHVAVSLRDAARAADRPAAPVPTVPIGIGDDGLRVFLRLGERAPHGSVHGRFPARAALLYSMVNGMVRRQATADETRFVLVGDACLSLESDLAAGLRQVVVRPDVADVVEALDGEFHQRSLLLEEADAAGRARPGLGHIVVVTESPGPEATSAWVRALRPELGLHLLVLDGSAEPTVDLHYHVLLEGGGAGRIMTGRLARTAAAPDPGLPFRTLLPLPRIDRAAQLMDEQRQAVALGRSGRPLEALAALRNIQAEQRTTLGDDHPATLSTSFETGVLLLRTQEFEEALGILEETATRRAASLGPGHPDTLAAQQQWAYALGGLGRHDQAYDLHSMVLASLAASAGPDAPATLRCRHDLAETLIALRLPALAAGEARTAHEGRVRVLGDGHPDTLASAHQLVVALYRAGRAEEARAAARDLHARRLRLVGEGHADTLAARRLLDEGPPPEE
ncbi:SAV_2336 N-terminal domain-related protein [Streptomyces sp. NPDC016172]|uniref:SAV_2336 N-terminal domain-related protein n=1 Tax=Streptomyces sp. NPDC016172 TaxID=3364964 RepID=UPI0036FEC749